MTEPETRPELLLATRNPGKVAEIKLLLGDVGFMITDLRKYPEMPQAEEAGDSFYSNAVEKARVACLKTGMISLADDSGLVVRALNGAPGVFSNRFAGPGATDDQKNQVILDLLADVPDEDRDAEFVCVVAVVTPWGETYTSEGRCKGRIARAARGQNGFGYDPIFYIPEKGKTFAELEIAEKNLLSHRAKALWGIRPFLHKIRSQCGG